MSDTVYIVAPTPAEGSRICAALSPEGLDLRTFDSAEALLAVLNVCSCGCVVAPVDLPGVGLRGLIAALRSRQSCFPVVVLGREDDLRVAVDVIRAGAREFVEHPPTARRLQSAVRRAVAEARAASSTQSH